MAISVRLLLKGTAWTTGAFLLGNIFRLLTSIILARILAPEIFGVMLIVYTIRAGIELTSDFGVGQNIVYNKNAEDPEFYNTAWTLQLIRNVILFVIFLVAVVPAARFYESPILLYIMPLTAFSFLFTGLTSVSPNLLRKRLQFAKLNVYDVFLGFMHSASHISGALVSPTIWGLVFGYLFSSAAGTIGSYFLLSDV